MVEFSAKQIAEFLQGTIVGNPDVKVSNFSKIEEGTPNTLSFLSNPKYTPYIYTTKASVVLVNNSFVPEQKIEATLIKVEDSYRALCTLLTLVDQNKPRLKGIDSLAYVSPKAIVGKDVYIAAFAYVSDGAVIADGAEIYPHTFVGKNATVGVNTTLYSGVKIYNDCKVGDNCILHASCVIGADGFGFAPQPDGTYKKIPQIGNVVIGNNVEVGANATIDRATLGSTKIHDGVKIDNLVHLAHNVEVGANTAMAAQCGVAGSTKIGNNCVFGGQVGVAGHLNIASQSMFGAQTGVSGNIKQEKEIWMGSPAIPIRKYRRVAAASHNLPDLLTEVAILRRELQQLKDSINSK